jgi:hypothetical protein
MGCWSRFWWKWVTAIESPDVLALCAWQASIWRRPVPILTATVNMALLWVYIDGCSQYGTDLGLC